MNTKYTIEEILSKFKAKHGDRYDYSKVKYVSANQKVTIICSEHGEFEAYPIKHYRGSNCPSCGRLTQNELLNRFRQVHGERYDYSKVVFVSSKSKVKIICKLHGEFEQRAYKHYGGSNCPYCSRSTLKLEKVLNEFTQVHGTKYNYTKVKYVNTHSTVEIICPYHGPFFQSPSAHKKGAECPKCAIKKVSANKIIKRSKTILTEFESVHGKNYDYSKFIYKGLHTKSIVICKIHGEFKVSPSSHYHSKSGCPKCNGGVRETQKSFIERCTKVHNGKYDYSKLKYESANKKVIIICSEHGEFKQSASLHLRGANCPKCMGNYRYTTEEMIQRFIEVHGDNYEYSKVQYVNDDTKIIVTCKTHGDFKTNSGTHVLGHGCPSCAGNKPLTKKEVLERFSVAHGDRYDYSKVKITNINSKAIIICKQHGEFKQTVSKHFSGQGCPFCTLTPQSKQELMINFELQQFFPRINPRGYKTRVDGKLWSIDIYLPSINLGIEFDGHYWHKEKADLDKVKTLQLKGEGFEMIRIREEPLERLFDSDIMSKDPFNAKQVVNDILTQIMNTYDLDKDVKSKIKHYISLKKLKNQDALNEYIEEIMEEKESRKN